MAYNLVLASKRDHSVNLRITAATLAVLCSAMTSCHARASHTPVTELAADRSEVRFLGCRITNTEDATGRLVLDSGLIQPWVAELAVQGGRLTVLQPRGARGFAAGDGFVSLPDVAPVNVSWGPASAGLVRCAPGDIETQHANTWVEGSVRAPTEAIVEVTGCGGWTTASDDGSWRLAVVPGEACRVYARQAGETWWTFLWELTPRAGETSWAGDVTLQRQPYAVFGFDGSTPPRVMVLADHRGLRVGDIVVAVDGVELVDTPNPVGTAGNALMRCPGIAQYLVERPTGVVQVSLQCGWASL